MASTPQPSPPPSRPPWRRLLAAQESGLILVILTLGCVLTILCRVPVVDREDIAPAATVETARDGTITVTDAGSVETYNAPAGTNGRGWVLERDADGQHLIRRTTFNRFLSRGNLVGIAKDASFIAVMAVGVMGIIILGGIDLSIGSVYALSAVVGALALHALEVAFLDGGSGAPWYLSLPTGVGICCLVGAACGALSGTAIVGLRVHPFIITLGGMAVYRGLAFVITKGQSIGDFPDSFTRGAFKASLLGTNPIPMFIMIAVAAAGAFVLARTVFGRRTYAIGGNETAARYAGIPVGRIKILWYTIGGLLAGLSAAMLLGYYGAASSDAGPGYELKVIAAAVVGGASLSGGRGTATGAMLGALVIQLIDNGIIVLGVDSNYTNIVIGLAIILAVVIDQAKLRLTSG
jgi:ribose/xylose/arabinose/galactoside ABC-type transport system permease subunit